MIIENCCCHNQLPTVAALSLKEGRPVTYHTNGDVIVERVLFSVANLVGSDATLTLVIPKLNIALLRYLNHGYERGWWSKVQLLTAPGNEKLIRDELLSVKKSDLKIVEDRRISSTSQMILLEGNARDILLTGYHPISSPTDNGQPYRLSHHTLFYLVRGTHTDLWNEVTKIPLTPLRLRK